ncbi:MAG: type II/IV secretion system protein, partial [Microcystis aeruginosa]
MTFSSKKTRAVALRNYFSPFGNKLVQSGYIGADQMQQALVETRKSGRSLVEILQQLTGRALPPDLQRQYKKNQLFELKILYGVESIDPELTDVDGLEIARLIDSLIPIDLCRRYRLIPLRRIEGEPASILIAMVDPDNLEATDDINRILRPRELGLQRLVITSEDYERLLEKFHWAQPELEREKARLAKEKELEKLSDLTDIVASIEVVSGADDEVADDLGEGDANQAPVINLVNRILAKALQEGTSDIHIEPQEEF